MGKCFRLKEYNMFIDPETKESLAHSRNEKYSVWNEGIARDKPGGLGRS